MMDVERDQLPLDLGIPMPDAVSLRAGLLKHLIAVVRAADIAVDNSEVMQDGTVVIRPPYTDALAGALEDMEQFCESHEQGDVFSMAAMAENVFADLLRGGG